MKNYYRGKVLKYLEFHLYKDLLILFKIIDKSFTKLEKVYKKFYYKKYIMEKFWKSKIVLRFFNTFYSKFIKLIVKLEFIKKILL